MKSATWPWCSPTIRSLRLPETSAQHEAATDRLGHGAHTRHEDRQHDHADPQHHRHQGRSAGEEAEGEAGVELQGQTEGPPHVDGFVEMVFGHRGGHTVGHNDDGGQGEGHNPGPGIAARVQRRDSPPLLQATQSRAYGRARRRGLGIG